MRYLSITWKLPANIVVKFLSFAFRRVSSKPEEEGPLSDEVREKHFTTIFIGSFNLILKYLAIELYWRWPFSQYYFDVEASLLRIYVLH